MGRFLKKPALIFFENRSIFTLDLSKSILGYSNSIMIIETKEVFFYKDIKDFLTNHIGADRIFKKLTNCDPIKLTKSQMVKELYASSEIEDMKIILERFKDLYLVVGFGQKFKLILIDTSEIMPLKYYQSPDFLKMIIAVFIINVLCFTNLGHFWLIFH